MALGTLVCFSLFAAAVDVDVEISLEFEVEVSALDGRACRCDASGLVARGSWSFRLLRLAGLDELELYKISSAGGSS